MSVSGLGDRQSEARRYGDQMDYGAGGPALASGPLAGVRSHNLSYPEAGVQAVSATPDARPFLADLFTIIIRTSE